MESALDNRQSVCALTVTHSAYSREHNHGGDGDERAFARQLEVHEANAHDYRHLDYYHHYLCQDVGEQNLRCRYA